MKKIILCSALIASSSILGAILQNPEISNAAMGGGKKPPSKPTANLPKSKSPLSKGITQSAIKKSGKIQSSKSSIIEKPTLGDPMDINSPSTSGTNTKNPKPKQAPLLFIDSDSDSDSSNTSGSSTSKKNIPEVIIIDSDDESDSNNSSSSSKSLKRSSPITYKDPSPLPLKKRILSRQTDSKDYPEQVSITESNDTNTKPQEPITLKSLLEQPSTSGKKNIDQGSLKVKPKRKSNYQNISKIKLPNPPKKPTAPTKRKSKLVLKSYDPLKTPAVVNIDPTKYKITFKKTETGKITNFVKPINKRIDKVKKPEKYYNTLPKTRKPLSISPLADPIINARNNLSSLGEKLMDTVPQN